MTAAAATDWLTAFLRAYDALDAALVRAGWPATSDWWRRQLERFLRSGRRSFVLRVGRRGGKSSTLCRFAVAWALWGQYRVPPGDVGVVAFVSVSRDESSQRLRTIEAILRELSQSYRRIGDSIELEDRPVVFRTFAASIAGVSGFTAILFVCDEVAKWRDADTGANPAGEVLASARPTMATQPTARMFLCSSPLGIEDAHAEAYERGDTDAQIIAHAPSWRANPTITEQQTRELEPDERVHSREYAAIPQATLSSAFDPELVTAAGRPFPRVRYTAPVLALDASAGAACEFAHAIVSWGQPVTSGEPIDHTVPLRDAAGNDVSHIYEIERGKVARSAVGHPVVRADAQPLMRPFLAVSDYGGFQDWRQHMGLDHIVASLANKMHQRGVGLAVGDGFEGSGLESHFRQHGLRFVGIPTTSPSKNGAIKRLRLLMSGRQIIIGDERAREQLLAYREIIDGATIRHAARSGAKADRVSVIVNALIAEAEGHLPWSPLWSNRRGRGGIPHEAIG